MSTVTDRPAGDAEAIIAAATAAAAVAPVELDTAKLYTAVTDTGKSRDTIDLERFLPSPRRARGTFRPATVDAFIAITQRHRDDEATTVWVHPTSGKIVAVLNDHHPDGPQWRDHQVVLQLQHTPEWAYWLAKNNQMRDQEAFAEHIEGGLQEITSPPAADMLEIAQTFHAHNDVQFRSSKRLSTGEQRLQYDEQLQAAAGTAGDMLIPTEIALAIAPFVGEQPYRVTARLRFRVASGRLTLGYKLDRPEAVITDALEKVAERLVAEFPLTYLGDPPTAA